MAIGYRVYGTTLRVQGRGSRHVAEADSDAPGAAKMRRVALQLEAILDRILKIILIKNWPKRQIEELFR